MQAHRYGAMLAMIEGRKLAPERLITKTVNLEQTIEVLTSMDRSDAPGIAVITDFS